MSGMKMTL